MPQLRPQQRLFVPRAMQDVGEHRHAVCSRLIAFAQVFVLALKLVLVAL